MKSKWHIAALAALLFLAGCGGSDYVAELVVNDGNSASQPDRAVITAVPAVSDTSPPMVEYMEVPNSPIDVSSGSARARIRVKLRDNISGVTGDILGLRSPSGSQSEGVFIDPAGSPNTFEAVLVTGEFSVSAETGKRAPSAPNHRVGAGGYNTQALRRRSMRSPAGGLLQ